jgi:hypothetical protein
MEGQKMDWEGLVQFALPGTHEGDSPSMPPGGPRWSAHHPALFTQWQKDRCQP